MDDISRELPPDQTGATPVSERQKGPEELQRFERGQIGEHAEDSSTPVDRLAGMGAQYLSDRLPDGHVQAHALAEGLVSGVPSDEEPAEAQPAEAQPAEAQPAEAQPAEGQQAEAWAEDSQAVEPPSEEAQVGEAQVAEAQESEGPDAESSDSTPGTIDAGEAADAVAAEASTAEVQQDLDELADTELGEDGLPVVPQLEDPKDIARMVYVLMMTSREGMTVFRLAQACNTSQKLVEEALAVLVEQLRGLNLPVELTRVGDTVRWMSSAAAFPYLQRLRGVRKLERLSPAALETLAVIAYRQPVMRSEIEAIRGVKAGPMLRTLLQHKLVKVTGRADVPGRPLQYGTTQQFLERFGLASLQDLPSVKEWKNLG